MKKQGRIIAGFIVVFLIALFSVFNVDKVPLNLGFTKIEAPLILIILVSAFLGALLIFVNSFSTVHQKNKELKELKENREKEIEALNNQWEQKLYEKIDEKQAEARETYPEKTNEKENTTLNV